MKKTLLVLCAVVIMSSGAYAGQIWDAVASWAPVNAPQSESSTWTYRAGDWPASPGNYGGSGLTPGVLLPYANPAGDIGLPGYKDGNPGEQSWVELNSAGGATMFNMKIMQVTWLSPITGLVDVSGQLQCEYATYGRDRNWVLLHNGVTVQTWVNPDNVTPYSVAMSVAAGDTISMRAVKIPSSTNAYYDHLSMTVTEVPEPATLALLACGSLLLRRIRRS
jgi:hypothetical protein